MFTEQDSHYTYIEKYGEQFSQALGLPYSVNELTVAHGDKAYGYRHEWEGSGIPFAKGVMIFLLSYMHPWSKTVRETSDGWVDTCDWVIDLYKNNEKIQAALADLPNYFTVDR